MVSLYNKQAAFDQEMIILVAHFFRFYVTHQTFDWTLIFVSRCAGRIYFYCKYFYREIANVQR